MTSSLARRERSRSFRAIRPLIDRGQGVTQIVQCCLQAMQCIHLLMLGNGQ
jgi:hypothetical protein